MSMAKSKVSAKILGDFVMLKDPIGEGSFAKVYKGYRKSDKMQVAIKVLSKAKIDNNPKLKSSLEFEITVLRRKELDKRHIIDLMAVQKSKNHYYLVMEYCRGGDLSNFIRERGALPAPLAQRFLSHIAKGLRSLRELNIVHRDLKPQNLLLTTDDDNAVVKIADFGFAREIEPHEMAFTFCGSPLYMAPEVLEGQNYNEKADLWSVGIILFEMLTGSTPYLANNIVQLAKVIKEKPLPVSPKIPMDAVSLLAGLLKPDPILRFTFEQFFDHPYVRSLLKDEPKIQPLQPLQPQQQEQQLSQPQPSPPKSSLSSLLASEKANMEVVAREEKREEEQQPLSRTPPTKPRSTAPMLIPVRSGNVNEFAVAKSLETQSTPPSVQLSVSPLARMGFRIPKTTPFNAETLEKTLIPEKPKQIHDVARILRLHLRDMLSMSGSGHITFVPSIFDFSALSLGVLDENNVKLLVRLEEFAKQAWSVAEAAYWYDKQGKHVEALSLYIKAMQLLQLINNQMKPMTASLEPNQPDRLVALSSWTHHNYNYLLNRAEKTRIKTRQLQSDANKDVSAENLLFNYALKLGRDSGFEEYATNNTNCIAMCYRSKLVLEFLLNHSDVFTEKDDRASLMGYINLFKHRISSLKKPQLG